MRRKACSRSALLAALALVAALSAGAAQTARAGTVGGYRTTGTAPPSTDPYTASLRYARCLRQHGVPHPDPGRKGDFQLKPADEWRLRAVGRAKREAAENACFHHLKGLNLRPLSPEAIARAERVVADLAECLRKKGHRVGAPDVQNLSRGRARFGLESLPYMQSRAYWESAAGRQHVLDMHTCERKIDMARRITKIIHEDRRRHDL
jgi:hypothetical protein